MTGVVHHLLGPVIAPGERVVDCTVGNGHDALFLALAVGRGGHLTGFDIQRRAIEATGRRLRRAGIEEERFSLIPCSHETVADHVAPGIAAAVFNLGYLPGSSRSVATQKENTLRAASAALGLLRPGGVLSLALYYGHEGGAEEARAVHRWAGSLERGTCTVLRLTWPCLPNDPPSILLVQKIGPAPTPLRPG